jgi:hypothetical protein
MWTAVTSHSMYSYAAQPLYFNAGVCFCLLSGQNVCSTAILSLPFCKNEGESNENLKRVLIY